MEIYTLDCPIENIPKYIGFTSKSLNERLKEHLRDNRNTKKCSWIKNLKNKNMIPIIKNLDYCNENNWRDLEIYWISQFKVWGFDLKNTTFGGDGAFGYRHTEESKLKNSLRNIGKKVSDDVKLKISNKLKGKKVNDNSKLKMSCSKIGIPLSEEHKLKIGLGNKGKTLSDDIRLKISNKLKGVKKKKHNRKGKNIIKCDLNNNIIEYYNSIGEASNLNNMSRTAIINNLKNRTKTSGNYIWKYLENIKKK